MSKSKFTWKWGLIAALIVVAVLWLVLPMLKGLGGTGGGSSTVLSIGGPKW